jgi:hypothetical protein
MRRVHAKIVGAEEVEAEVDIAEAAGVGTAATAIDC